MQLRGSRFKFPSRLSSNLDKNWADERTILKDIKKIHWLDAIVRKIGLCEDGQLMRLMMMNMIKVTMMMIVVNGDQNDVRRRSQFHQLLPIVYFESSKEYISGIYPFHLRISQW